ncbi:MAG: prolyl oligopeptidase family serine peptidase [Planctomycetes bacterium]|nr:prolyl oligopeptidase family serine peptidase [Planctomycetota bacterium]
MNRYDDYASSAAQVRNNSAGRRIKRFALWFVIAAAGPSIVLLNAQRQLENDNTDREEEIAGTNNVPHAEPVNAPPVSPPKANFTYPETAADDFAESIHGTSVADPFRWLEVETEEKVRDWTSAQNALTNEVISNFAPFKTELAERLTELSKIGSVGAPQAYKNRHFFGRHDGVSNHSRIFYFDGVEGEEKLILDPNSWSEDGTTSLDWYRPSTDGKFVAYGRSEGGTELSVTFVLDVDRNELLDDEIPFTRAASVSWLPDNSGFYYTRTPVPGTVAEGEEQYHRRVYFHKLGTSWEIDPRIFGDGLEKEDWPGAGVSSDGRWLLISVSKGWTRTDLFLCNIEKPGALIVPIASSVEATFAADIIDDTIYILTNDQAPKFRIMKASVFAPSRRDWTTLVPESEDTISTFVVTKDSVVVASMHNAIDRLTVYSKTGEKKSEIAMPSGLGALAGLNGTHESNEIFYGFTSFQTPRDIYRYDLERNRQTLFARIEAGIDSSAFEAKQVFYPSADGTQVSMFIVHKKELVLSGNAPTYLTGYGGFSIAMQPYFSSSVCLWLENGGVFALPNLRGGSEYGESWHKDGMLEKKQNCFDDFIAAAEWLIEHNYTNPEKLAIGGGSNGGLLIGAAITQRPELFRAALCKVPLLDMIRYHKFPLGSLWTSEYGDPDDAEDFEWIYRYSPYHHVVEGTRYPATLFTAAEGDTRVNPLHARKMAAALQAATSDSIEEAPILLRIQEKAGHGAGKPLSMYIDESAQEWAFIMWQVGMSPRN